MVIEKNFSHTNATAPTTKRVKHDATMIFFLLIYSQEAPPPQSDAEPLPHEPQQPGPEQEVPGSEQVGASACAIVPRVTPFVPPVVLEEKKTRKNPRIAIIMVPPRRTFLLSSATIYI